MNKIFHKTVLKWLLTGVLLMCASLSFANVNCNNSTWDVAPGDPVVSVKGSDITVSYTFSSVNLRNGDGCLITHLSNQISTANITSRDGKTVLLRFNSFEFGQRGGLPFFCYGTSLGQTECANGFSANVASGSVSYNITNNIINANNYVFSYKYKGIVNADWKLCPVVEFMSRNASISKFPIPCAIGVATRPTCSLNVPSTLNMRSILIESLPSQFSEASSTDFDMILSCPKSSLVFTPTVTFKFTEILSGSNCTAINESNGGPQNIGFAFKNGVTRICGTTTNGGVNALPFPTSTLDTAYSQSKKISVAYTRTSSAAVTAGAVISTVTFTTSYQ